MRGWSHSPRKADSAGNCSGPPSPLPWSWERPDVKPTDRPQEPAFLVPGRGSVGGFGGGLRAPGLWGLQGTSEATLFWVLIEGLICEGLGVLSQTVPHVERPPAGSGPRTPSGSCSTFPRMTTELPMPWEAPQTWAGQNHKPPLAWQTPVLCPAHTPAPTHIRGVRLPVAGVCLHSAGI